MKWIWLALIVVVGLFVYVERDKLYVRDPVGTVSRNGVPEAGAQVYVNRRDEVILENDHLPRYLLVVQHDRIVGVPTPIQCLFDVLCLAPADPIPQIAPLTGRPAERMTRQQIQFKDENAREVDVKIR